MAFARPIGRLAAAAALGALVQTSSLAPVQAMTGNAFHARCGDVGDSVSDGFCLGFVVGGFEGLAFGAAATMVGADYPAMERDLRALSELGLGFCAPEGVFEEQLVELFSAYLAAHPERRHESARLLLHEALVKGFPCG